MNAPQKLLFVISNFIFHLILVFIYSYLLLQIFQNILPEYNLNYNIALGISLIFLTLKFVLNVSEKATDGTWAEFANYMANTLLRIAFLYAYISVAIWIYTM